mmetsp:Transcript_59360/g.168809  ORF Transcript_59360/g.168809 Transcript_59360/m.168809 type:complete len:373 (+) Transcript_59360:696-1814(+)
MGARGNLRAQAQPAEEAAEPPSPATKASADPPARRSPRGSRLHHLQVHRALVADGGHPPNGAVRLDLALHPHEPGLLFPAGPLANLDDLTLLKLPGGVLELARVLLGAASVELEGLCEDGVLHDLEDVPALLQECRALRARERHPALDLVLHDRHPDAQHVDGVLFGGALENLHDLARLEPPQRLAVLDVDGRRDDRVLRDLHEGADEVHELVLADKALLVVVQGAEDPGELLVRWGGGLLHFLLFGLAVLSLGLLLALGLRRLELALLAEGSELGLIDLVIAVGVDRREELVVLQLVRALVVLDNVEHARLQRVQLVGLFPLGVLAKPRADAGGLRQARLVVRHLLLELAHLDGDPQLQSSLDTLGEVHDL